MTTTENKLPMHRAYFVKGEVENARWLELAALWAYSDGKGFDVVLETVPVGGFNGRLTLRAIEPKTKE